MVEQQQLVLQSIAPKQIKKNVTFNLADNAKPQATLMVFQSGKQLGIQSSQCLEVLTLTRN